TTSAASRNVDEMRLHVPRLDAVKKKYCETNNLQGDCTARRKLAAGTKAADAARIPNRGQDDILARIGKAGWRVVNANRARPGVRWWIANQVCDALPRWSVHVSCFHRVELAAANVCIRASRNVGPVIGTA